MEQLNSENVAIEKENLITAPFLVSTHIDRNTRRKLEDRFVIETDLNKAFDLDLKHQYKYFAIFDGHVNDLAAEYCKNNLHLNLIQNENFKNGQISLALKETFLQTDKDFCDELLKDSKKSGCTALCCVVEDNHKIYLAWAGDSASIITRNGNPTHLTKIHSAEVLEERERIKKMGGESIRTDVWRVMGILAVSRSIGDPDYKPFVTAEPDIIELELDGSEDFLVLASDGLWDTLNPVDASMLIYQFLAYNAEEDEAKVLSQASKFLVENSIEEGSSDNITAIILFLKDLKNISFPTEKITEISNGHNLNGNSKSLENGNSQNGYSMNNDFSKSFPLNINARPFEPNFNNISLSGISSIRALQEQALNDACQLNINITSNEDVTHDDNLCAINETSFNENTEDLPSLLPNFNEQINDSKKEEFLNNLNTFSNNQETDEIEKELDEERVLLNEDKVLEKEIIEDFSNEVCKNENNDILKEINKAQKINSEDDLLNMNETNVETIVQNLDKNGVSENTNNCQEANSQIILDEEPIENSITDNSEDKNLVETQLIENEEIKNEVTKEVNCFDFNNSECISNNIVENECEINNHEENNIISDSNDNEKTVECEYSVIPTESKASPIEIISNSNEDLIEKNNESYFENTPVSPFEHLENDEEDEKICDNADLTLIESLQKLDINSEKLDSNNVEDKVIDNKHDEIKSEDTSFEFIEKDNLDKSVIDCINNETTCYQTPQGNFSKIGQENSVYENADQSFDDLHNKDLIDFPTKQNNLFDESFNLENDILKFDLKNETEEISNQRNLNNNEVNEINSFTDNEKTDLNMKSMEIVDDNNLDETLVYENEKKNLNNNYDVFEKEEQLVSDDSETSIDSVKFEEKNHKQDLVDFVQTNNPEEVVDVKLYDNLNSEKSFKNSELDSTIVLDQSSKIEEKVNNIIVDLNNFDDQNGINFENVLEKKDINVSEKNDLPNQIVTEDSSDQFTLLKLENDGNNDKEEMINFSETEIVPEKSNLLQSEEFLTINNENLIEKEQETIKDIETEKDNKFENEFLITKENGFLTEKENDFVNVNVNEFVNEQENEIEKMNDTKQGNENIKDDENSKNIENEKENTLEKESKTEVEELVCQNKSEVSSDIKTLEKDSSIKKDETTDKIKKDLKKPISKILSNKKIDDKKILKKVEPVTRASSAILKNKVSSANKSSQLKSTKDLKSSLKENDSANLKKKPVESLISKTTNASKLKSIPKTTSTLQSRISSSTLVTKKTSLPSASMKPVDVKKPLLGKTSSTLTSRLSTKTVNNTSTDKSKVSSEKPISSRVITSTTSSRLSASTNTRSIGSSVKSTSSLPKTTVKTTSTVSTNKVSTSRPSTLSNKYANIPSKITTNLGTTKTTNLRPLSSSVNNKNDAPLLKKPTTSKINTKPSTLSNKLIDTKPKVGLTRPKTLSKTTTKPLTNATSKITSVSSKINVKKETIVSNHENEQGEEKGLSNSEAKSVISNSQSINGHMNNYINGSPLSENTINSIQTTMPTSKSRDKLTNSLKAELEAAMELNGSPK